MNLIASASNEWAIGFENNLLFNVPADKRFFKATTIGNVVVMGRKTFLSLPGQRPLVDRVNIVLSHDEYFAPDGVTVVHSVQELKKYLAEYDDDKVFVIGGANVYELLLPECNRAYITSFHASAKKADRFLPRIDRDDGWQLVSRSEPQQYEDLEFTFDTYERKVR